MKRIACWTMIGAKSNIKDRPNSYEVFGIDYMIDTNYNTWLIEINKNPALEYSTVFTIFFNLTSHQPITERMSKQLQRDIADLVEGYFLKGYNPYSVKKQPELKEIGQLKMIYRNKFLF